MNYRKIIAITSLSLTLSTNLLYSNNAYADWHRREHYDYGQRHNYGHDSRGWRGNDRWGHNNIPAYNYNRGGHHGNGRTIAGLAVGALLGSVLAVELSKRDRPYYSQATIQTFEYAPSGNVTNWVNPDTGVSGTITPLNTFQSNNNYCREFTQTVNVGNSLKQAYGTACRQPDGSWQIQP